MDSDGPAVHEDTDSASRFENGILCVSACTWHLAGKELSIFISDREFYTRNECLWEIMTEEHPALPRVPDRLGR